VLGWFWCGGEIVNCNCIGTADQKDERENADTANSIQLLLWYPRFPAFLIPAIGSSPAVCDLAQLSKVCRIASAVAMRV
jgi:hypothetical protein